ncbi:OpgC family protein [Methylocapsa acidiphila]|uniref:OpgC family protein n=1 Tax=Methylocapsa acidiphila TaxID=133552 RepID=UPI0003FCCC99|nr:OpgC domain-containing protein [Methylocapsa acidiphila]
MRAPNEIDFWRGFALLTIFINHVPGLYFERFTFRNVSLSDSAELFVLLAGWAMRKLIDGPARALSGSALVLRLEGRAMTVYVAQTVITEIAIALLAAASLLLDAPFLIDWHNASAVFNDPVRAHIGLVLLTHQLGYFNILPLYVVLVVGAPIIVLTHRNAARALLPFSFALYAGALAFGVNFRTWPVEGTWFFNPLAWQLIYVLGFLLGGKDGVGGFARQWRKTLRLLAIPIVLLGALVAVSGYSPDPIDLPSPKLLFMFDKTYLSPARLIHSLALAALFGGSFAAIARWTPRLSHFFSLLGRNSLNVFCAASILSLSAQILRFATGGGITTDALIVMVGFSSMGLVAWLSEWRERLPAAPGRGPPSPSGAPSP